MKERNKVELIITFIPFDGGVEVNTGIQTVKDHDLVELGCDNILKSTGREERQLILIINQYLQNYDIVNIRVI